MEQTFPEQKYTSIETSELERLRAQVSKVPMAPHTFAQMVNRVRDLAFDFGTTEQFRDRVSELLGEYVDPDAEAPAVVPERAAWLTIDEMANALVLGFGAPIATAKGFAKAIADASIEKGSRASQGGGSAWVPPVETHRVVVPELTEFMREFMIEDGELPPICGVLHQWLRCRALQAIREHSRAIPADRVLGDGMVQISAELLAAYEELWDMARIRCRATTEKEYGKQWRKIDALRVNQGGAAI